MSAKYLLPCSCGQKLTVDTTQAGLTLDCPCGNRVEVPPWREIRALEQIGAPAPVVQRGWSTKHGIIFLSLVMAICSAGGSAVVWALIPDFEHSHPNDEQIQKAYQTLPLEESFKEWDALKTGPELPADPHEAAYAVYRNLRMRWVYAGLILSTLCLVCAVITSLIHIR